METNVKKRDYGIDFIKMIAILGVLIIHTCKYDSDVSGFNFISALFWGSISRASVPLFFMASGAILLNPQKKLTIKKLYFHNILRIAAALFFWAMIYKMYHLLQSDAFSAGNVLQAAKEVLTFNQEFHFYYLQIILIVYAFLPITRIVVKHADKSEIEYFLIFWFVFSVIYPFMLKFRPFNLFGGITGQWVINMTYAAIGYTVLGYYIKKYGSSKILSLIVALAGFLIIFKGTLYMSQKNGVLYEGLLDATTPGVVFLACGIFGFFADFKREMKSVTWISKASFCIYLVHILSIDFMEWLGVNINICPYIVSIPVFAAGVFAVSAFLYFILSKIPVVNKWLI